MNSSRGSRRMYDQLPLAPAHREIRVLTIQEGSDDSPVVCTLTTVSLDAGPPFSAISYCWGNATKAARVIVNGWTLEVTEHLESVLRCLRHRFKSCQPGEAPGLAFLWIDAICINQADTVERSAQVQLMKDIYVTASDVLIWLGGSNVNTQQALALMNSDSFRAAIARLKPAEQAAEIDQVPSADMIMVDTVIKHDLCKREWWSRLWVKQEFILAKQPPTLLVGASSISWNRFLEVFTLVPRSWTYPEHATKWELSRKELRLDGSEIASFPGVHPISLDRLREEYQRSQFLEFCRVLRYLLRNSATTERHDYIYGLLGLLRPEDRCQITVDYSQNHMTLYEQVAVILWTKYASLTLSELLPELHFNGEMNDRPSWIPDFGRNNARGWQDHKICRTDKPWRNWSGACFVNKGELHLSGVYFDRTQTVHQTPSNLLDETDMARKLREFERYLSEARDRGISEDHALYNVASLKKAETVTSFFTKTSTSRDDLFPGYSDEQIWEEVINADDSVVKSSSLSKPSKDVTARLRACLSRKFLNKYMFITEAGLTGISVPEVKVNDVIAFFFGACAPVVLRPYPECYRVVGCAYLSGFMDVDKLDQFYENDSLCATLFKLR